MKIPIFKRGDLVVFLPERRIYEFKYTGATGLAIICPPGEEDTQSSCAVDFENLKALEEYTNDAG